MKTIYLVRHGESELNVKRIHQNGNSKLTEKGINQAEQLANRLKNLPIDKLISSPFQRAKHTAEIIEKEIKINISYEPLLIELKRPSEFEGKKIIDPDVIAINKIISKNWENEGFRYSDEETFYEFRDRAKKVIELLSKLENEHVLVVTHGELIRMIVFMIAFKESLKPHHFFDFRKVFSLTNTGITVLGYEESKWKLLTWNDYSHLPF